MKLLKLFAECFNAVPKSPFIGNEIAFLLLGSDLVGRAEVFLIRRQVSFQLLDTYTRVKSLILSLSYCLTETQQLFPTSFQLLSAPLQLLLSCSLTVS